MDLRYVVTTDCNADCFFCLNEYIGSKSNKYITTPRNYGDLSKVAVELNADGSTITGGEPTIRRDLGDIVAEIRNAGLDATVVSNGYRLQGHMNAWKNVTKLHVSYHTFDENEWKRITKVKGGPQIVAENLIAVRESNPNLIMRLNVVATKENSTPESLSLYLDLAQRARANISVFQNGYLRLLKEMGRLDEISERPVDFWDLDTIGGELIADTSRIKTYQFDKVQVHLTYLSSEMHNGSTFWITPLNEGFADIRKKSPLIDFNQSLQAKDLGKIKKAFLSLSREAELLRETEQKGINPLKSTEYKKLIEKRKKTLDTVENKNFF